jgi:hypothetical protein
MKPVSSVLRSCIRGPQDAKACETPAGAGQRPVRSRKELVKGACKQLVRALKACRGPVQG